MFLSQIGAQSARAASPNLSQKTNLKPYLTDELLKEKKSSSNTNLTVQGQQQLSGSKSSLEPLQGSHTNLASMPPAATTTTTTAAATATAAATMANSTTTTTTTTTTATTAGGAATSSSTTTATNLSVNDAKDPKAAGDAAGAQQLPSFDIESFVRDWRHFECQTWHLEPTVRLLSWAGKSIEPYGVDYILNKLGFSHARTTIPKWLQRGFMDPLDKVQALLMLQLLLMVRENKSDPAAGNAKQQQQQNQQHRPSAN